MLFVNRDVEHQTIAFTFVPHRAREVKVGGAPRQLGSSEHIPPQGKAVCDQVVCLWLLLTLPLPSNSGVRGLAWI